MNSIQLGGDVVAGSALRDSNAREESGTTAVAGLSLALGIGASTAILQRGVWGADFAVSLCALRRKSGRCRCAM